MSSFAPVRSVDALDTDAAGQLDRASGREADERRRRRVGPAGAEQRMLQLAVHPVERTVLPVEPAAGLAGRDEQRQQDRLEERSVGARPVTGAAREDRRRRLAAQLVERDPRVRELRKEVRTPSR